MNRYNIWMEGYNSTGMGGVAQLFAEDVEGDTFKDAVLDFMKNRKEADIYFSTDPLAWWGCGLFEHEEDARRGFG